MDVYGEARSALGAELQREGGIDLARAAMTLGLIERPNLRLPAENARLDALLNAVTSEVRPALSPDAAAAALRQALAVQRGFRGQAENYDDPRNCFLHNALSQRHAMPIVLTVLYMAAGARCGVPVAGVGLPWHFIARVGDGTAGYCYLDPFAEGAALQPEPIVGFLQQRGIEPGERLDLWLAAVTPRQILTRMLLNIKRVYLERRDDRRARLAVELLLTISPWSLEEIHDRGLLSARLGDTADARADLTLYLERAPDAANAQRVRAILRALDGR